MPGIDHAVLYLLIGIGLVTLLDSIGSIISRRLLFDYRYFGIFSLIVYTFTSFSIAGKAGAPLAMIAVLLVGVYDATAGWLICQKLQAYYKIPDELKYKLTLSNRLVAVFVFSILCGLAGIWLAD